MKSLKHLLLFSTICLLGSVGVSPSRGENAPALSPKQALQLAEQALAPKNPSGKVYITSLVLQQTSLMNGKRVWTVQWSESVEGSKPGSKEVGLEIGMDGSVLHLIKGRGTGKHTSPH